MKFLKSILVVSMAGAVTACSTTGTVSSSRAPVSCDQVTGTQLEKALAIATGELDNPDCAGWFDSYWESLLSIAEREPSKENRVSFANFIGSARDQGVITSSEAKERYSRFFDPRFVSLPDDYNVCSYQSKRKSLDSSMLTELRDKEQGLLRISQDKASYAKSVRLYHNLQNVMDATLTSCEAG